MYRFLLFLVFGILYQVTFSQSYNSTGNGVWETDAIWNPAPPPPAIAPPTTITGVGQQVSIYSSVQTNATLDVNNGGILNIGYDSNADADSLIINTATLSLSLGGIVNVDTDGVLYIDGDCYNIFLGTINIYGVLKVVGNFTNTAATINIFPGGEFYVGGNLDNSWTGSIDNQGNTLVGGNYNEVFGNSSGNPILDDMGMSQVLPIELLSFNAIPYHNNVHLTWQTASEKYNDYFTLERSFDGVNFIKVTDIEGAGNSTSILNYSYIDYPQTKNVIYYRLKQTDYDGKSETFNTISVNVLKQNKVTAGPNPANNHIIINTPDKQNEVFIYDLSGKLLSKHYTSSTISNFNISELDSGIYIIKVKSKFETFTRQIIKT